MMKKVFIVFCLSLLPFVCLYSQIGVDSACKQNMENIFKVHTLKIKYETVQFIYEERQKSSFLFAKNSDMLNYYFKLIRGVPYFEDQKDSISDLNPKELVPVPVEWMSKEEVNSFFEQLNYTPEDAFKEYRDFIQRIKLEKETYLKCIDAEIAKGDVLEYAKDRLYDFKPFWSSLAPPWITKIDFLKGFKEFVINDDEEVLPDVLRVKVYLKCGCKISPYWSLFLEI